MVQTHSAASVCAVALAVLSPSMMPSAASAAPPVLAPCNRPKTLVIRTGSGESAWLAFKNCKGEPNLDALTTLSVLARPKHVDAPDAAALKTYDAALKDGRANPYYAAKGIMRLHQGLLRRLHVVTQRFPGKAIEVVSGHRPNSRETSRHHQGRALDFRLRGVSRLKLVQALRDLQRTGLGYYPNSLFVHLDVRKEQGFWVDASAPGKPSRYVPWPKAMAQAKAAKRRNAGRILSREKQRHSPSASRNVAQLTRAESKAVRQRVLLQASEALKKLAAATATRRHDSDS